MRRLFLDRYVHHTSKHTTSYLLNTTKIQVVSVERPELEEKAQQLQHAFQVRLYMCDGVS